MPLSVIKATPVVSFILLAILVYNVSSAHLCFCAYEPAIITSSVALGIANIDIKLKQMVVYALQKQKILHIYLPSVFPSFARRLSAFGLSWKVVIAAEVISLPKRAWYKFANGKVHIEQLTSLLLAF